MGDGLFFFRVIVCSGEWMQASQEAGEPRRCFFFFFFAHERSIIQKPYVYAFLLGIHC